MSFKSLPTPSIGVTGSPSTISATVATSTTNTIIGLSLANVGTAPVTASVKIIKANATTAFLIKDAIVPLGGALIVVGGDQKLVLEAGDSLTAYCSAASSVDAVMSYLV
ncbi:hypothetical protein [Polynucleobacter sp. UK-Kesae-W10]|uniref:hypothetical protein n=1 Tax=Polynucleobacter sp. UK-Kesae-W10 TaxID=1819738 RepID=UPI001C0B45C8|nr:hypothetical protein [Polynucleobacter sp. UK-Kesae-W10]MBU3577584.1 hypothetical protein [Polynucleobacter sp. UK-Kesae-W10]